MKPFRERNPVIVGAISILVLVLLVVAALEAKNLPLIGGGDTYYATFTEAGGLKTGDEVRIAGVRVGEVDSIELDNGYVKVGFKIKSDAKFGDQSEADIKVKTLLGDEYLALVPKGDGQMAEGSTIPVDQTQSPYDVVSAFTDLAKTSDNIDTDQLAHALTTLADLTRSTPTEFRNALQGISALSTTIASKNEQIGSLLKDLSRVSDVLDSRDQDIVALMHDADTLFKALIQRKVAIHNILVATSDLSTQLTGLVRDSRADLKPALDHLHNVLDVLNKNDDNLDQSLRVLAPFYRYFANVFGNGPWWDTYINNLPPVPGSGGGVTP